MFIWLVSIAILQKSWAGMTIFDESPISCDLDIREKKCSLVLCGDKNSGWVGIIILPQRGKQGDINDFIKNFSKYEDKVKKKYLKNIFLKNKKPANLAGHLQFNKSKSHWIGNLEAQFDIQSDLIEFKSFEIKDVYSVSSKN